MKELKGLIPVKIFMFNFQLKTRPDFRACWPLWVMCEYFRWCWSFRDKKKVL